mgnify:CR=1 FL=1
MVWVETPTNPLLNVADIEALADVAHHSGYVRPEIDESDVLDLEDSRHPVVERMPLSEGFVPNDVLLDRSGNRLLVITGPNNGGKTTYIRQVGQMYWLAHVGMAIPAEAAEITFSHRPAAKNRKLQGKLRLKSYWLSPRKYGAGMLRPS